MDPVTTLPTLLLWAWLLPLASFVVIVFLGKFMGPAGKFAGYVATGAIGTSCLLSLIALFGVWLPSHPLADASHHSSTDASHHSSTDALHHNSHEDAGHEADAAATHANNGPPDYYFGDWYSLGVFGKLKLTIGYYIDTLTVAMFCMVTFIASCVHLYATGYMHDELHDFTDPEVTLSSGRKLKRAGRYYRFFQYLCYSASACWAW